MAQPTRLARLPRVGDGKISFIPNDADHDGWLLLGSAVRMVGKSKYPQLFTIYGTAYGGSDAGTTFGLPPAGDRFLLAAGQARALGVKGGSEAVTLTPDQMPKHKHTGQKVAITPTPPQKALLTSVLGIGLSDISKPPTVTDGTGDTTEAGAGAAHDNMPPFLTVNVFIFAGMPVA